MRVTRRQLLLGTVAGVTTAGGCLQRSLADGRTGGETPQASPEEPRVDKPPYEIADQPDDAEAWNPLYLCEQMPADADLDFTMVSPPPLSEPLLSLQDRDGDAYAVRVLTSAADVREVFETGGPDDTASEGSKGETPLDATDFEEYVLLVIESGYGSSSVTHHWKRVEATDRGVRLHGCHRIPYLRTADIAPRHSVVRIERPQGFAVGRVSLTVSAERRVHFNSTEGVVSITPPT